MSDKEIEKESSNILDLFENADFTNTYNRKLALEPYERAEEIKNIINRIVFLSLGQLKEVNEYLEKMKNEKHD